MGHIAMAGEHLMDPSSMRQDWPLERSLESLDTEMLLGTSSPLGMGSMVILSLDSKVRFTKYSRYWNFYFHSLVLSQSKRVNKARRKIIRKEENRSKQENNRIFEVEDNHLESNSKGSKQSLNEIVKDDPEVINGRKVLINKRARQLLSKDDIIKNRKAFIGGK